MQGFSPRRGRACAGWIATAALALAWVDELDTGNIDDYLRLDLRLSWRPLENLELSLVGQNLADPHQEFGDGLLTQATKVPRGVYGGIRWLGW